MLALSIKNSPCLGHELESVGATCSVILATERLVRGGCSIAEQLSVRQPRRLDRGRLDLTGYGRDQVDLDEAVTKRLGLLRPLSGSGHDLGQRGLDLAKPIERCLIVHEDLGERLACVLIQRRTLSSGLLESHLIALPMNRDEGIGDLDQHGRRHRTPAQESPTAPFGDDRARQHHRAVVELGSSVGGPVHHRLRKVVPSSVHLSARVAPAHERRICPAPQKQSDSGEHHGFPGACLAGDCRESDVRLEHGVIYDAQAANADLLDHGRSESRRPRHPSTGSSNLRTRRSVKGALCRRAKRTGEACRVTSTRLPGGSSTRRRPSHHRTPWA